MKQIGIKYNYVFSNRRHKIRQINGGQKIKISVLTFLKISISIFATNLLWRTNINLVTATNIKYSKIIQSKKLKNCILIINKVNRDDTSTINDKKTTNMQLTYFGGQI